MTANVLAPMIGMIAGVMAFAGFAWLWRGWLLAHAELGALLTGAAVAALIGGAAMFELSQAAGVVPG